MFLKVQSETVCSVTSPSLRKVDPRAGKGHERDSSVEPTKRTADENEVVEGEKSLPLERVAALPVSEIMIMCEKEMIPNE